MSKDKVKIVLIGAGSRQFARALVRDLVLERELTEGLEVSCTFVDLNQKRLLDILEYARQCAHLTGAALDFSATTDREAALDGADFVLLSVAVQRMDLWEQDFRVPLAFGIKHIYGENGGPGAMFHALRNMKIILPICRDVQKYCPDSVVMNFTNPEARILQAILNLTPLKALGLCHGFYEFHHLAAELLDRRLADLDIRTAGMNHFFTYYRISDRATGEDLRPHFERALRDRPQMLPPLVRRFWEAFGALGICSDRHLGEYISWAHEFAPLTWPFGIESRKVLRSETIVTSQMAYRAWEHRVDIERYMTEHYGKDSDDQAGPAPSAGDMRPSGELAVPIVADILFDRRILRPAVNVLNAQGYVENLARDACVEVPAVIDAQGIHPDFAGDLPEAFAAQIRLQHSIQKLILQAYVEQSRKILLQALLIDPVVRSATQAERLLDCMLALQAEYLPEFH